MNRRVLLYCLLGGLPLTFAALGAGHFPWWWLSGILIAAAFVPVALFGPRKGLGQFAVVSLALLIVTVLCLWSEAVVFLPQSRQRAMQDLVSSVIMYTVLAAVLAILSQLLKLSKPVEMVVPHRSGAGTALMVLLSGLSYTLYYLIFGTLTYQFFTKGYYPEAQQIVRSLGPWFWPMEIARGVLMAFSVLPIILTLRMKRWHAAIVVGLLLWIIGGLAPLVLPNEILGGTQRLIHTVEIFTENFPFGVTAVLLLRPQSAQGLASVPAASSATD